VSFGQTPQSLGIKKVKKKQTDFIV
jgi:hypothetical protein